MGNIIFVLLRRIHSPLIVLICVYALAIMGFVLIPGMDNQGRVWHMDFFHAFYFVSFMGTTIGFGEIPYPFTDAQRLWTIITIYASVIAWLYAIGSLLAIIQDPAFRELNRINAFRRAVRRIAEPFYLICGYGGTGSLLVKALTESSIRCVVIDTQQERINSLSLEDLVLPVPGLCADVAKPDVLLTAGLQHRKCIGVVTLTDHDEVNLKVALTSKLLNPALRTIVRTETHDVEAHVALFGANEIINPFDTFAGRLALALHSPGMFMLYEWMTGVPHEPLCKPLFPPRGTWILCGYGRFGKAVHDKLSAEGVVTTIIEAEPKLTGAPEGTVIGDGTETAALREAGIAEAVGIVAGTDDDINNLSIIRAARTLNPELFMVARQNLTTNNIIFQAAQLDLIMRRGSVIAHKIFAVITTPLLADFLRLARPQDNDWANRLISRIGKLADGEVPQVEALQITEAAAPALCAGIRRGDQVEISVLSRDPRERRETLPAFPLLLKRGHEEWLLPDDSFILQENDQILFCGRHGFSADMEWIAKNHNVYHYIHFGEEHPSSILWRLFTHRHRREKKIM